MAKKKKADAAPKNKGLELSQKVTLHTAYFCMAIVVAALVMNFLLLWFYRQPMTQEFMTVVATYGAITSTLTFAGYVVLNTVRQTSLNKTQRHKIEHVGSSEPVIPAASQTGIHNETEENDA